MVMPSKQDSLEQRRENADERGGLARRSPCPPYPTPRGKAHHHRGFTFPLAYAERADKNALDDDTL
jgi:hypothetical protein